MAWTITPTMTLQPTLSVEDSQKMLVGLLENNGECLFPCWFGYTPGVSPYADSETFLETFVSVKEKKRSKEYREMYFIFQNPPNLAMERSLSGVIRGIDEGQLLSVRFDAPIVYYPISKILTYFGSPDQIRLWAAGYDMGLSKAGSFWIVLYYREKGIMIEYEGYMEKARTLDICVSPEKLREYGRILLWDPGLNYSFTDAGSILGLYTKEISTQEYIDREYKQIDELSVLDIQAFYDLYHLESIDVKCFQVPDLDWPNE